MRHAACAMQHAPCMRLGASACMHHASFAPAEPLCNRPAPSHASLRMGAGALVWRGCKETCFEVLTKASSTLCAVLAEVSCPSHALSASASVTLCLCQPAPSTPSPPSQRVKAPCPFWGKRWFWPFSGGLRPQRPAAPNTHTHSARGCRWCALRWPFGCTPRAASAPRRCAVASRACTRAWVFGNRPSATGHRLQAIGYRPSATGHRLQAIGYRP